MTYCTETRNILEKFAGLSVEEIRLRRETFGFSMACVNIERNINLGGLIRTAECFGSDAFALCGKAHFDRRACVGAQNYLSLVKFEDWLGFFDWLIATKRNLVCVDKSSDSIPIQEFTYPENPCFLMGAEVGGIPEDFYKIPHTSLHIPQYGAIRSLNVSTAGAIVAYDYTTKHIKVS